jgi:hypothetical protein
LAVESNQAWKQLAKDQPLILVGRHWGVREFEPIGEGDRDRVQPLGRVSSDEAWVFRLRLRRRG